MKLSFRSVQEAIEQLRHYHPFFGITFLVCKKGNLRVGSKGKFSINTEEEKFLMKHFKPDLKSRYYFQPFRSASKEGRWLVEKYPFSGSQSTRTRGDLALAFLHDKGTDYWGWKSDYVNTLRGKLDRDNQGRIPLLWLAVWIYKDKDFDVPIAPNALIQGFIDEFHITKAEESELFQTPHPKEGLPDLFEGEPYSDERLLMIVEAAPDALPEEGGTLKLLELQGIGPARDIKFDPAEKLNIITGDNGLGKTFILETAWWALTGHWAEKSAAPRLDANKGEPSITFEIAGGKRRVERIKIEYDWDSQSWPTPKNRPTIPGLIVYARVDGSFAVWDPIRSFSESSFTDRVNKRGLYLFSRDEVFRGLDGRIEGLLRDWVTWQRSADDSVFKTFKNVLKKLSPPESPPLEPDEPIRIPGDSREIPTLSHTYGTVPFIYESAGVRRIASIAYLLVWAWNEHRINAALAKKSPQQKMVILIDEIEAHLHPKWQRVVIPALLDVIKVLSTQIEPQIIITTHSPLVLASTESSFSESSDGLYHLELSENGAVSFSQIPFVRQGTVDAWLRSDIFALKQARSREGEDAIEGAKKLMGEKSATVAALRGAHLALVRTLGEEDDFWPMWGYFLQKRGIEP